MSERRRAGTRSPTLLLGASALPNGASLTLLSLLRWTQRSLDAQPRAALLASGPLREEFRRAGARVLGASPSPLHFVERTARRLGQPKVAKAARIGRHAPLFHRPPRPRVVFASTIQAAGPSLRFLGGETRLVTHAFEPGEVLDALLTPRMMDRLARGTSLWMAASDEVAGALEARGVPEHRLVLVPPFVDVAGVDPAATRRTRDRLGARPGEVVVGGVGRSDWRDGPDAFIRMATVVRRRRPDLPVRFVWVGAPADGPTRWILDHDVGRAALSEVFTFVGDLVETEDFVGTFDVLAQTSRVDATTPASLVAAARGVPTVAFAPPSLAGSGIPTLDPVPPVRDDLGVEVVPYLDVEAMAARVVELVGDPAARADAAAARRQRAGSSLDVDERAAAMWELLEITAYGRPRHEGASR